jgi:hypothetical protein
MTLQLGQSMLDLRGCATWLCVVLFLSGLVLASSRDVCLLDFPSDGSLTFAEWRATAEASSASAGLGLVTGERWVVITSVNQPTEAVAKLVADKEWRVVVVGDKKSAVAGAEYDIYGANGEAVDQENLVYLSYKGQADLHFQTYHKLGDSHYSRKMIGYLYAISKGAKVGSVQCAVCVHQVCRVLFL